MDVHLTDVYLMGVHPVVVRLIGMCLTGVHLIHLTGIRLAPSSQF